MTWFYSVFKGLKNSNFFDYIFISIVLLSIGLLTFLIVTTIKYKKEKLKNKIVLKSISCDDKTAVVPKSIEYLSCVEDGYSVYQGYIDINYLKELVSELKSSPLDYEDEKFVDEFETYLLNFVKRQPSTLERATLSDYIGKVIKKIAKYS